MSRLTIEEFSQAFRSVVPESDEVIVLYSGLWAFGHRFGIRPAELVDHLIESMLEVLGPERTLIMPTYFGEFPRSKVYDLIRSRPYTGAIADRFRMWPGSIRTRQPMDSYAVCGPRAGEVLAQPCTTAWGDDSVLGWFDRVDARHVILGVPWHLSCAYCHRGEEVLGVPFRYYKRFGGALLSDGEPKGECQEIMYVRPFDVDPKLSYKPTRDRLGELGLVLESDHPDFQLQSSLSSDILEVSLQLLEANPLIFVGDSEAIRLWIASGREQEIAQLRADQTPPFAQRALQ